MMMAGFRRAQLTGSEELFRPTARPAPRDPMLDGTPPAQDAEVHTTQAATSTPVPAAAGSPVAPATVTPQTPLTGTDIDLLSSLLQRAKFPHNPVHKPSLDDFEQLEELRKKLAQMRQR